MPENSKDTRTTPPPLCQANWTENTLHAKKGQNCTFQATAFVEVKGLFTFHAMMCSLHAIETRAYYPTCPVTITALPDGRPRTT
jgi:hypothetical protein